jgi:hypothetical protein
MAYIVRKDGEGWEIRNRVPFKIACCDCGLVHNMVIVAPGKRRGAILGIAAERNPRATGGKRARQRHPKGRTMSLSRYELLLIAQCLELAGEAFSNHGCNDIEARFWAEAEVNGSDMHTLLREMQEWNGDNEHPHPAQVGSIGDWMLMGFFAAKLRKLAQHADVK